MFDYAGIALYSYGSGIQSFYGSSDKKMYELLDGIYLPGLSILAFINFCVLCFAKVYYGQNPNNNYKRHALFLSTLGVHYMYCSLVVLPRYYNCYYDDACHLSSLNHITIFWIMFILCAFFFGSHFSEILFPGKCDIIGSGHHILHVLINILQILQLRAMKIDFQTGAVDHTDPKCFALILSFVFVVISQVGIFFLFESIVERKLSCVNKSS